MTYSRQRGYVGNAVHRILAARVSATLATFHGEDLLPYLGAAVCLVFSVAIWIKAW